MERKRARLRACTSLRERPTRPRPPPPPLPLSSVFLKVLARRGTAPTDGEKEAELGALHAHWTLKAVVQGVMIREPLRAARAGALAVWEPADDRVKDAYYLEGGRNGPKTPITQQSDGECADLANIHANWRRAAHLDQQTGGLTECRVQLLRRHPGTQGIVGQNRTHVNQRR